MKRVTGIGGIFFKCRDAEGQRAWYREHFGIEGDDHGAMFKWRDHDQPENVGYTAWGPFREDSKYFGPSDKPYMINYRAAWIMDPEGNRIEPWEPKGDAPD